MKGEHVRRDRYRERAGGSADAAPADPAEQQDREEDHGQDQPDCPHQRGRGEQRTQADGGARRRLSAQPQAVRHRPDDEQRERGVAEDGLFDVELVGVEQQRCCGQGGADATHAEGADQAVDEHRGGQSIRCSGAG